MKNKKMLKEQRQGCCTNFWGPFRPILGGHSIEEAGTSAFLPTSLVLMWRIVFAVTMTSTFVYYMITDVYNLKFYSSWSHLAISVSFFLTSGASLAALVSGKNTDKRSPSALASFVVIFFQTFATCALFLVVVYWALIYNDPRPVFHQIAQHALNIIFALADMLLCMRMKFKVVYVLFFVCYTFAYIAFAWIRYVALKDWTYAFLDYTKQSVGQTVGYYVGLFAWGLISGALMILVSRLSRCFVTRKREHDEHADTVVSQV